MILKRARRKSEKSGLPPGSLVYVGDERSGRVEISCIRYNESKFQSSPSNSPDECLPEDGLVTWTDVTGIHDADIIARCGDLFDLHPLVQEDILNTEHRPKLEEFDDYLFMVLKTFETVPDGQSVIEDQVSIVLGKGYVLSFQEIPVDLFDAIRERLEKARGRIRKMGADYLAYALIDSVVDRYFSLLELLAERIEELQESLIASPGPEAMNEIHALKRDVLILRKSLWPLREVANTLSRLESDLIDEHTRPFLRDVYDHVIQVLDTVEAYRDMIAGMFDTYISSVSLRMNQIMQVLTVIATIFIPLTFITGLYGMNFQHMPELGWRYGYPAALGLMLAVVLGMLWYFKRKKWF